MTSIYSFIEKLIEIEKEEDPEYINKLLESLIKSYQAVYKYNITEGGITNFINILENIVHAMPTESIFFITVADIDVLLLSIKNFIKKYENDETYNDIIDNIRKTVAEYDKNKDVHTFISQIIDILNNNQQANTEKVPNTYPIGYFDNITNNNETFYVFNNMLEKYNKYQNINAILQSNITDIVNLSEQIINLHELAIKKKYLKYKNKYLSLKKRVKNL